MQLKTQALPNQAGVLIAIDSEHLDAGSTPEFKIYNTLEEALAQA